jgi:maleylacetoacetate isomerase/maleylpyruvate isomerase
MEDLELFTYFRSSAAYRVRIALHWKGLAAAMTPISLVANEHSKESYLALNPQGLVPLLQTPRGSLSQSLAIIEYLDDRYPQPPLRPNNLWQRAQDRSMALTIACDLHPLNNLRVLKYLTDVLHISEGQKQLWYAHWVHEALAALEVKISAEQMYCAGASPGLSDICLVPQLFNARRFEVDLSAYPKLCVIEQRLARLPAFEQAHPDLQPDKF